MGDAVGRLEQIHSLPQGRLRFEVQVETPQLILGADGTSPVAMLPHAVPGRISGLHYGTYDYSASLEIAAAYQSMEHPAADFAKAVMQLAVAGTGIRLSDGSSNIVPVGAGFETPGACMRGWCAASLERGYYQGWDLHPAQLPTRYFATYAFYREGFEPRPSELRELCARDAVGLMDEPATARALAAFRLAGRAVRRCRCSEVAERAGDHRSASCGRSRTRKLSRDNSEERRHHGSQLLYPAGRTAGADRTPHRPCDRHRGLHGHPQAACCATS